MLMTGWKNKETNKWMEITPLPICDKIIEKAKNKHLI